MKTNNWQETLQVISDYDAIAKWTLKNGYGYYWMPVPSNQEIQENGFSDTAKSPLEFDDLAFIEIHKHCEHGNCKIEYYIESIQKSISSITNLHVSSENEILRIESTQQRG